MILDTVVRTCAALLASVDGCEGGAADLKVCKRVVLDLNGVAGRALRYGFDLAGLSTTVSLGPDHEMS